MDPLVFRFSDSKREREIFLSGLDIHCSIQGLIRPLEAKQKHFSRGAGKEPGERKRGRDSSNGRPFFQPPGTGFCK